MTNLHDKIVAALKPYAPTRSTHFYKRIDGSEAIFDDVVGPDNKFYREEVRLIQQALGVHADGHIGPETRKAAIHACELMQKVDKPPAKAEIDERSVEAALDVWFNGPNWRDAADANQRRALVRRMLQAATDTALLKRPAEI